MRRLREALRDLPAVARWSVLGLAALLLGVLVGTGVWGFLQHQQTVAARAFAAANATYRAAVASGNEATLGVAAQTLQQFLKDYRRSSLASAAFYLLGNLEYERRAYDGALAAFTDAAARDSGSIGALSRLGIGYAWEAKGEPARALEVYRQALSGRDTKDFLYGEFLLAMARVQEELKQGGAAIETYKRFLTDVPASSRASDVRMRLALLGAGA